MTINKNSVEQINVALLDMDKKIKSAISNGTSASDFKNLEASVDNIKRTLDEAKAGLEPGKTYDINISGNAATANKATTATTATRAETADKVANALTVNGKTYNGSEAVDAGVQTVANGGTGVTTQADINKAFIGNLEVGASDVTDGTEFVSSWASDNGFAETTDGAVNKPYKRKFIKVWNYIKGKISSVLGLTKDNYGGKAATAGSASTAAAILDYAKGTPIKVRWGGSGINSAEWYPAFNADGSAIEPIHRTNIHAGTADNAKNMYSQTFDLSALDKTMFYPLVCISNTDFAEVAICSESRMGHMEYNQNRIHFDISTDGWNDLPYTLNIREYACFDNNEITIGCIGRGLRYGAWAIWLRGGLHYTCFSRDADLSLKTSDYTYGDETYTVGTNYYGGSNSNVGVAFTPQYTITEGAYSSRPITSPIIKGYYRMVIPIGAPASLEDGCIWIER